MFIWTAYIEYTVTLAFRLIEYYKDGNFVINEKILLKYIDKPIIGYNNHS